MENSPNNATALLNCHTALVLMMDQSTSIHPDNWRLQVNATANALESEDFLAVIRHNGSIAVAAYSFNEGARQMVDWQLIDSPETASQFAKALRHHAQAIPDDTNGIFTHTSKAIHQGIDSLASPQREAVCPYPFSQVIDLSTDGQPKRRMDGYGMVLESAEWRAVEAARDEAFYNGIRINVIPVNIENENIIEAVRERMITPGGWLFPANWDNYAEEIQRKIVTELSEQITPTREQMQAATTGEAQLGELAPNAPMTAASLATHTVSLH